MNIDQFFLQRLFYITIGFLLGLYIHHVFIINNNQEKIYTVDTIKCDTIKKN